jgi:hypothetical protein
MKAAPPWVTYVTTAVAVMALVVSIATYVRAGPRVRVKLSLSGWWRTEDADVTVTVINRGLAPVDVSSIVMSFRMFFGTIHIAELTGSNYRSDEAPLLRLEPGSQRKWNYKLSDLARQAALDFDSTGPLRNLFARLSSGRPRVKFTLSRILFPLPFLHYLLSGVAMSVDLGNGIQKSSLPSYVLTLRLFLHPAYLAHPDGEDSKAVRPDKLPGSAS